VACNNKKDLTNLISKMRITPYGGRHFFDCYLWETREDLQANAYVEDDPCKDSPSNGCCIRMPYILRFKRPAWMPAWAWLKRVLPEWVLNLFIKPTVFNYPRLGELHFASGGVWDMEIVSHECAHAALSLTRAYGALPQNVFAFDGSIAHSLERFEGYSDEELHCYFSGELMAQVYRWLWTVDPDDKWRKVE